MNRKVFLTEKGLNKLKEELKNLKQIERPKVSEMIGEAKSYGDLSENSEYKAALERRDEVEEKIKQIENKLKNYELIDEKNINTNNVSIGCLVKLLDYEMNEELVYRISGSTESDVENCIISNDSPIGSELMGKKKGDIVSVETPNGNIKFKILDITI